MARPRSDEKRQAILDAATQIIAAQGLGAPTALIAKQANVSNGTLFNYFETKGDLFNELFVALKTESARAAFDDLPEQDSTRARLRHVWRKWLNWIVANPVKRRAMAQLGVSSEIKAASHQRAGAALAGLVAIVEEARAAGPMPDAPLGLTLSMLNAVAEATMDYMVRDLVNADAHCEVAFDAVWRMIA